LSIYGFFDCDKSWELTFFHAVKALIGFFFGKIGSKKIQQFMKRGKQSIK
jgi:hypothetical protein